MLHADSFLLTPGFTNSSVNKVIADAAQKDVVAGLGVDDALEAYLPESVRGDAPLQLANTVQIVGAPGTPLTAAD